MYVYLGPLQEYDINGIHSLIITQLPNFKEEFLKLSVLLQNICVTYLLSRKNYNLLSQVIMCSDIKMEIKKKLYVLLEVGLHDDAYNLICTDDLGPKISVNIHNLLDYMYDNAKKYDFVKFFSVLFTKLPYEDQFAIMRNLPKKLGSFCDIFTLLCEEINRTYSGEYVRNNNLYEGLELLCKFVNEYNLQGHLQHFITQKHENFIISNIIIQNVLNLRMSSLTNTISVIPSKKVVILTQNMFKNNMNNINYIITNLVKRDHNMLTVLHNYKYQITDCTDIDLGNLVTFLQNAQSSDRITDDSLNDNFTFSGCSEHVLLEYFITNNFVKCLEKCLNENKNIKYSRRHIQMASKNKSLSVLKKFKNNYTISKVTKHIICNSS
jgi:hypothetical protein